MNVGPTMNDQGKMAPSKTNPKLEHPVTTNPSNGTTQISNDNDAKSSFHTAYHQDPNLAKASMQTDYLSVPNKTAFNSMATSGVDYHTKTENGEFQSRKVTSAAELGIGDSQVHPYGMSKFRSEKDIDVDIRTKKENEDEEFLTPVSHSQLNEAK